MDEAKALIPYVAPLILPPWISAWYWRYYALKGAVAAHRWLGIYLDVYGWNTPWAVRYDPPK